MDCLLIESRSLIVIFQKNKQKYKMEGERHATVLDPNPWNQMIVWLQDVLNYQELWLGSQAIASSMRLIERKASPMQRMGKLGNGKHEKYLEGKGKTTATHVWGAWEDTHLGSEGLMLNSSTICIKFCNTSVCWNLVMRHFLQMLVMTKKSIN